MGGPGVIDGTEHPETDNFLPCQLVIDGITYLSSENYFQCTKTTNELDREMILNSGPGDACQLAGQTVGLRSDWKSIKSDDMYKGNLAKFQQNEDLRKLLVEPGTRSVHFTESTPFCNPNPLSPNNSPRSHRKIPKSLGTPCRNHWNDIIVQIIRAELCQNGDEDARLAAEICETMKKYAQENK
ncbi:unnamed protein product [Rotaria magnacalcarata]